MNGNAKANSKKLKSNKKSNVKRKPQKISLRLMKGNGYKRKRSSNYKSRKTEK